MPARKRLRQEDLSWRPAWDTYIRMLGVRVELSDRCVLNLCEALGSIPKQNKKQNVFNPFTCTMRMDTFQTPLSLCFMLFS
jgi:hypothetical protein